MRYSHHRKSVCIKTPPPGLRGSQVITDLLSLGLSDFQLLCPLSGDTSIRGSHAQDPGAALPVRAVEVASLQQDLGHVLPQAHKQDTLAVEDLQAPDGLPPPLWEELHLFQQTAA